MTTQDKQTALNAISKAMDEDIENIIEGKEIDIPETEETCFRQEQVYVHLMNRINSKRKKFSWLKIAVVLLPFLILNMAFWIYSDTDNREAVTRDIYVPCGERMTVMLADGTKVYLNADTKLTYPELFVGKERKVSVEGEAYFEVAKNKKIPFFVNTEINRVKVVGTHFNVCAYKGSNEFETTLIEGIVDIYPIGSDQVITRLTKDEFFGSYNGKYKKTTLPSYEYLRWKEGLYCFDDAPFNSLLNKLEKYYNVNISVRNLNILNYRCTGKFKEQDGIEHILKVIQKDHKFTYSINEEKDSIIIE